MGSLRVGGQLCSGPGRTGSGSPTPPASPAAKTCSGSPRIVGWKTSDRCHTDLILAALEYGIWSRDVRDGELIHHSDRGPNYTSFRFSDRLQDNGILPSMGSVGDSFDNALMENFWSTFKIELVYRTSWRTRDEAENAIFAYIDGWCNTRRIQRELGYLSPDEYETAWHTRQHDPNPAAYHHPCANRQQVTTAPSKRGTSGSLYGHTSAGVGDSTSTAVVPPRPQTGRSNTSRSGAGHPLFTHHPSGSRCERAARCAVSP